LAIQYLQDAVGLDPGYLDAQSRLADLYWKRGQADAALDCLEAALQIDSDSENLQSNKAVALLALGRAGEAEQAARYAIRLDPSSEDAHYLLAVAQLRQGQTTSETLTHLSIAGRKSPAARELKNRVEGFLASERTH
jgi:tetratricopeptide (TPR) repeat protein